MEQQSSLGRRAFAEFLGTGFLVVAVIGSGIAASRLSPHDLGLELFENAAVTGAALVAIILAMGPISGGRLNPVITLIDRFVGGTTTRDASVYMAAQIAAAAYFFTSSTSFANPAVTFARTLSDTFAGISPSSVPGFIAFQLVGCVVALAAIRVLYPKTAGQADTVDAFDERRSS